MSRFRTFRALRRSLSSVVGTKMLASDAVLCHCLGKEPIVVKYYKLRKIYNHPIQSYVDIILFQLKGFSQF